jgi:medium-chain acyl-[acyl-carrier-protein] hydrolase
VDAGHIRPGVRPSASAGDGREEVGVVVALEVWRESFTVRSYEVDRHGRASAPAICNWLQETAGIHADRLGWSVHALAAKGLTWVLARLRLRLDRTVRWGAPVTVETWPAGVQRVYAQRDFRLTSGADPIGVATTSWLLMAIESRRPVRPARDLEALEVTSAGRALVDDGARIAELGEVSRERAVAVRHADLDVNGHANNVSVITWLLEALESTELELELAELDVEFRAEAVRHDAILSQAAPLPRPASAWAHRLVRSADAREIARGRSVWRS